MKYYAPHNTPGRADRVASAAKHQEPNLHGFGRLDRVLFFGRKRLPDSIESGIRLLLDLACDGESYVQREWLGAVSGREDLSKTAHDIIKAIQYVRNDSLMAILRPYQPGIGYRNEILEFLDNRVWQNVHVFSEFYRADLATPHGRKHYELACDLFGELHHPTGFGSLLSGVYRKQARPSDRETAKRHLTGLVLALAQILPWLVRLNSRHSRRDDQRILGLAVERLYTKATSILRGIRAIENSGSEYRFFNPLNQVIAEIVLSDNSDQVKKIVGRLWHPKESPLREIILRTRKILESEGATSVIGVIPPTVYALSTKGAVPFLDCSSQDPRWIDRTAQDLAIRARRNYWRYREAERAVGCKDPIIIQRTLSNDPTDEDDPDDIEL